MAKKSITLFFLLLFISCFKQEVNYQNQIEATKMAEQGIYYFWQGGDLEKIEKEFFKGITLKGNLDAVAFFFNKALYLDPKRLAYQFSLASTKIIQGKVEEALALYEGILKLDPMNFEAALLKTIYTHFENEDDLLTNLASLEAIDKIKAQLYREKLKKTFDLMKTSLETIPQKFFLTYTEEDHAIVLLGYALAKDGSIKETLLHRLEVTLAVHKRYPNSPIIVSGGMSQGGVTESFKMKNWLIAKGVRENLILLEDQAKDTVGNAIFSTAILKKLNTKAVTLVTSATHMRRGLVTFWEATQREGLKVEFNNQVYQDFSTHQEMNQISKNERLVIFRDLLRTSGIAAYPGIQL